MRALIANRPAMYREVISAALRELRPGIEVFTAEPEDLESEFVRLLPQLVVCSRLTKRVRFGAPVWIELYPDDAPYAVVGSLDGSRKTLPGIDFDTLLSILDGVSRARAGLTRWSVGEIPTCSSAARVVT